MSAFRVEPPAIVGLVSTFCLLAWTVTAAATVIAPTFSSTANPTVEPLGRAGTLAAADALLAAHSDAKAAQAYAALGHQSGSERESWRQNNWGLALLHLGRPARALAHFRASVEADRRNFIARANLGASYEQVGDLTKALEVYRRAVELLRIQNRNPRAGRSRHEATQEAGESLVAASGAGEEPAPLERPCALDEAAMKAALVRAGALLDAGRYAEARDAYAAIGQISARPREGWRLNNWGLCELRLAQPARARERLERSVAVFPGNPVAWNNLAVAYEQLGMETEAASAFAKGERGIRGADPQRLELVKVKLKYSMERRRWEALRR